MANEIKQLLGASTAMTISLGSLASSTAGAGRQSTMVDNTTTRFGRLLVFVKIKQGTSPTGSRGAQVYLVRGDGSGNRDDAAGASDAALTVLNAQPIGALVNKSSPATGDVLSGWFVVENPGREFGVAIVHDTGVNLDATGGNHDVRYVGINPEVQ
jgi:hypothetical protein